jgi:hypothetical protein
VQAIALEGKIPPMTSLKAGCCGSKDRFFSQN